MSSQVLLPGFGLPLNYKEFSNELFQNALNDGDMSIRMPPLTTLREFTMLNIMNKVTDKPNWHTKIFDDQIIQKWRAEMLSSGADVTEAMANWCIDELQYKAKIFEKTGAISVFNGDVVKSDTVIPPSLKESLRATVASLEQVPPGLQDWHPGSDGKVLDLVHPSLYPLVYGRSKILPTATVRLDNCIEESGQGEIIGIPSEDDGENAGGLWRGRATSKGFSRRFQWLPCNVTLSPDGNTVKIVSYINNLHPKKHKDLYTVIEKIIGHTIPLWNLTLSSLKGIDSKGLGWNRIQYSESKYDPDLAEWFEMDGLQQEEGEDEDDYYERKEEWYHSIRKVVLPEPGVFQPPQEDSESKCHQDGTNELKPQHSVDIFRDYMKNGLQVIVKLANIHLTPEKPVYKGGSWHVEGQLNEHICASAIYYYDTHNITSSKLAFRQLSNVDVVEDFIYDASDSHDWLPAVFGCENNSPLVQDVGAVATSEGRLLTWPNILQHQVQPFELENPTKPGHRKILALFLVDPNIHIISTANVPCQRRDWWADTIYNQESMISKLPAEVRDHIIKDVEEFPISLAEAKELRLDLMEERKAFTLVQDEAFHSYEISLCEH